MLQIETSAVNSILQELQSFENSDASVERGPTRFDSLDDSSIAKWLAHDRLRNLIAYNGAFEWLAYNGKFWKRVGRHEIVELVRREHDAAVSNAFTTMKDAEKMRRLLTLLNSPKIRNVVDLLKGLVHVDPELFDSHPDLLNVGNGIVNLRTGALEPHDPQAYLTKFVATEYSPVRTHSDWDKALRALPAEDMRWMQIRFGQGLTGYMTPDDVLPILVGGGSNGKSTILVGIATAVGPYQTTIPEKVLLANPSDHPTELMTLRGVRLGFIEELPEGKHLPVKRLKDLLGTPKLSARYAHKDNVEWDVTHSLFVTTNYLPAVDEVDHGTWRRLKIVRFPYKFVPHGAPSNANEISGDAGLRDRMLVGGEGRAEAVLSWLVEGAVKYFRDPDLLHAVPPRIENESASWRFEVDKLGKFLSEAVEFDHDAWVASTDLFASFTEWLRANGFSPWSEQTFAARLGSHEEFSNRGVEKKRISSSRAGRSNRFSIGGATGAQLSAWVGVKFKC
jgi:putative DNA primase/helicase